MSISNTENSFDVVSFSDFSQYIGDSVQAKYLKAYLSSPDIDAKTMVIENKYIDKDYIIDYSQFYSRSFKDYSKFTTRVHFFSDIFSKDELEQELTKCSIYSHRIKLVNSYLGFTIVKPVIHIVSHDFDDEVEDLKTSKGEKLIGRTIIKTYNKKVIEYTKDGEPSLDQRQFLRIKNKVNLFGVELEIESLPFQSQDIAVGACATTSLWVALQSLKESYNLNSFSLYEITKKSIECVEEYRNFPSGGLTTKQVLTFLKGIGLDYDILNFETLASDGRLVQNSTDIKNMIETTVKAFVKYANIPIIVFLKDYGHEDEFEELLRSSKTKEDELREINENYKCLHTAVISGYRYNENEMVTGLYAHDDSVGPYSKIETTLYGQSLMFWRMKSSFFKLIVKPIIMIIPLYPKMRLQYNIVYEYFLRQIEKTPSVPISKNGKWDLYFTTVQKYKSELINGGRFPSNIIEIVTESMPRFLWVFRYSDDRGNPVFDRIIDGTATEFSTFKEILHNTYISK